LVAKSGSCAEELGGQAWKDQAVVMTPLTFQQLAKVCNGKSKGGSQYGTLIPFGYPTGGWK